MRNGAEENYCHTEEWGKTKKKKGIKNGKGQCKPLYFVWESCLALGWAFASYGEHSRPGSPKSGHTLQNPGAGGRGHAAWAVPGAFTIEIRVAGMCDIKWRVPPQGDSGRKDLRVHEAGGCHTLLDHFSNEERQNPLQKRRIV